MMKMILKEELIIKMNLKNSTLGKLMMTHQTNHTRNNIFKVEEDKIKEIQNIIMMSKYLIKVKNQ